ncbi:MAG: GH25 family lysozyme [Streptosporangiaceae bacterium]
MAGVAGKIVIAGGLLAGTVSSGISAYAAAAPHVYPAGSVPGLDVSVYQGAGVNWPQVAAGGAKFVIIRATTGRNPNVPGTMYVDPNFVLNRDGSRAAGLLQGAYHFAVPDLSTGRAQAEFFVANGGGWTPDGRTLPGALDMEADKSSTRPTIKGLRKDCYNLTQPQMVAWVQQFSDRYFQLTGRNPIIYTGQSWWNTCTGGSAVFAPKNALWVANYQERPTTPAMPAGFSKFLIWQHWNHDKPKKVPSLLFPGDQTAFMGRYQDLVAFAARRDRPVANAGVKASSGKLRRGKKATFTFTVGNGGPDATPMVMKTKLSKYLFFRKEWNRYCRKDKNSITCSWPRVKPGQKATYKLQVQVGKSAKGKQGITFAVATVGTLDWARKNNVVTVAHKVLR